MGALVLLFERTAGYFSTIFSFRNWQKMRRMLIFLTKRHGDFLLASNHRFIQCKALSLLLNLSAIIGVGLFLDGSSMVD